MKKKNLIIAIISVIALVGAAGLFYILNSQDSKSTLTLLEKKWIESNKNDVIDLGMINNVAILNYEGEGLIFDFVNSLEEVTGLEFNKVSYEYGETNDSSYAIKVVEKVTKDDMLIYSDNHALFSKTNVKYNRVSDIKNITVGVLDSDIEEVNTYLNNNEILLKTFSSVDALIAELNNEASTVDAIVLPKLVYYSNLKEKNNFYINYNITEMQDNYVFSLGKENKLNEIVRKYYKKWSNENYDATFAKYFSNTYFSVNDVDDQDAVKFRSKRYTYSFIESKPFDVEVEGKLVGINNSIIEEFSSLANIEFVYKKYSTIDKLKKDFNANKIDIFFNTYATTKYDGDIYTTVSPYDEEVVVISDLNNDVVINSVNSLKNMNLSTIKGSLIEEYLKKLGANIKEYDKSTSLITKSNEYLVMDLSTYNYYKATTLKDYKIDFQFALDSNYSYIINDINNNKIFGDFLDFYLNFSNEKVLVNQGYYMAITNSQNYNLVKTMIYIAISLVSLLILVFLGKKIIPRKKKKRIVMKKEEKLRYIDMLTSLKNRNYLNDNIEKWDENEIYPQAIIVIDLNNLAYVNDNFGHQEGDNVIREAANILITNQQSNSEIIRTSGNEFLIYLVQYDEKQIVAYIRKLAKEFKELSHGFGAAIGYSMITDDIKTFDDAVNEATLDMRTNKEELNN